MQPYRIFLSSPSDVQQERDRAERVIRRLNAERTDHTQLELVRWEQAYYNANSDFQAQIPKPTDCHLVICIFWKRLGTELPSRYVRPNGTVPTGTEYEFESALEAAASKPDRLPDVLVYRKTAEVMFSAATLEFERAQYECFTAFWQRWFETEKGHFVAGFHTFKTPDDFEDVFERNLRSWLRNREVKITWTKGSPFRSLEPFDVEHAQIFFGRRREVERTRARLIACALVGKPFLLITGASGSGKSSLARAGLIPRLGQVGGLSTLGSALRWTIMTPTQIAGDWCLGFAKALFEKAAIGDELEQGDFQSATELKRQLALLDRVAVVPLLKALKRAGEVIAAKEKRSETPAVVLLILLDQFEELFAWPIAEAEAILQLLKSISEAPGATIWLVATMRSDFQHRLADFASLEVLTGRTEIRGPGGTERILELALPSPADLREMVLQPARAAGLTFESSADGSRDLAQLIEFGARPEAMPAIQFLLSELYSRRRDNVLTFEAFDAVGGVVGVMANRGEEVYLSVNNSARQAFPRVVRALVTQVRGDAPPSARPVSQGAFADDPPGAQMIEALKNARLVISDRGEMRLAHESILKFWKRFEDQIDEDQRLFETRERLEQLCRRWAAGGKKGYRPRELLLEGFQLAEGRELIAKWGSGSLIDRQPEFPAFIAASDARERRSRRVSQAVGWTVALAFALLSWSLYQTWLGADTARKEAQASLWVNNSRTALADRRVEAAIDYASKAFELLPNEDTRSALASASFELSPNLRASFAIGTGVDEALAWVTPDIVVFAPTNGERLRAVSPRDSTVALTDWVIPQFTRLQDGRRASIRLIHSVNSNRLLAVLDNGALALIERGATPPYMRPLSRHVTLAGTAHAAATGRSGTLIATANSDTDVLLLDCKLPPSPGPALDCTERWLKDVRGTAVAISPDEARIAVGDESGVVSVYDRSGRRVGKSIAIGGSLLALGWANGRDWLAAGTAAGNIVVIDVGAPERPRLAATSLARGPITTVAWSADGFDLAFACEGKAVCLWPSFTDADGSPNFGPVRRFEGHQNAVTRLVWSPSDKELASTSIDGTIRIWSRAQNPDIGMTFYADAVTQIWQVASSPDGRWLAGGAKDGSIRIWDAASGALLRTAKSSYTTEVAALAWSPSGLLAAVHDGHGITLVPTDPQQPLREIAVETAPINARIAFLDYDKILALPRHDDNTIALIDISGSSVPPRYLAPIGPTKSPFGLAVDPTRKVLFVSYTDADGEIVIWDLVTLTVSGEMAYLLPQKRDPIAGGSLSTTRDGKWLASSGGDNYVRVYNVPNRTTWQALPMKSDEPQCVAFSPDGTKLAALGADSRVYVWEFRKQHAEPFVALKAVSNRLAAVDMEKREPLASWLSWLGDDRIAIASGISAVDVLRLDSAKWRRRIVNPAVDAAYTP